MNEFVIEKGKLIEYTGSNSHVVIPEGVIEIERNAFSSSENLISVKIPGEIRTIGDYAFSNCKKLSHVSFCEGLQTIGESVFRYCENITTIKLPDSIKFIGNCCFYGCTRLNSINIPVTSHNFSCKSFSSDGKFAIREDSILPHLTIRNMGDVDIFIYMPNKKNLSLSLLNSYLRCIDIRKNLFSFNFELYDKLNNDLKIKDDKILSAFYRLRNPYNLNDSMQIKYWSYIKNNVDSLIALLIGIKDAAGINYILDENLITHKNIDAVMDKVSDYTDSSVKKILDEYKVNKLLITDEFEKEKESRHQVISALNETLKLAVISNNSDEVKMMLDRGANPEQIPEIMLTAVETGNAEIVETLLNTIALTKQKNEFDQTPLHLAVIRRDMVIAKILIDKKASITRLDEHKRSPLSLAAENGHVEMLCMLLATNQQITDFVAVDTLEKAILTGRIDVVKTIGEHIKKFEFSALALAEAIYLGKADIFTYLISKGCSLRIDEYGDQRKYLKKYELWFTEDVEDPYMINRYICSTALGDQLTDYRYGMSVKVPTAIDIESRIELVKEIILDLENHGVDLSFHFGYFLDYAIRQNNFSLADFLIEHSVTLPGRWVRNNQTNWNSQYQYFLRFIEPEASTELICYVGNHLGPNERIKLTPSYLNDERIKSEPARLVALLIGSGPDYCNDKISFIESAIENENIRALDILFNWGSISSKNIERLIEVAQKHQKVQSIAYLFNCKDRFDNRQKTYKL